MCPMVTPAPFAGASCAHAGTAANTAASKASAKRIFMDSSFLLLLGSHHGKTINHDSITQPPHDCQSAFLLFFSQRLEVRPPQQQQAATIAPNLDGRRSLGRIERKSRFRLNGASDISQLMSGMAVV